MGITESLLEVLGDQSTKLLSDPPRLASLHSPPLARMPELLAVLQRVQTISHPNCAQLLQFAQVEKGGVPYVLTVHSYDGKELGLATSPQQLLKVCESLTDAASAYQQANNCHNDIVYSNVLQSKDTILLQPPFRLARINDQHGILAVLLQCVEFAETRFFFPNGFQLEPGRATMWLGKAASRFGQSILEPLHLLLNKQPLSTVSKAVEQAKRSCSLAMSRRRVATEQFSSQNLSASKFRPGISLKVSRQQERPGYESTSSNSKFSYMSKPLGREGMSTVPEKLFIAQRAAPVVYARNSSLQVSRGSFLQTGIPSTPHQSTLTSSSRYAQPVMLVSNQQHLERASRAHSFIPNTPTPMTTPSTVAPAVPRAPYNPPYVPPKAPFVSTITPNPHHEIVSSSRYASPLAPPQQQRPQRSMSLATSKHDNMVLESRTKLSIPKVSTVKNAMLTQPAFTSNISKVSTVKNEMLTQPAFTSNISKVVKNEMLTQPAFTSNISFSPPRNNSFAASSPTEPGALAKPALMAQPNPQQFSKVIKVSPRQQSIPLFKASSAESSLSSFTQFPQSQPTTTATAVPNPMFNKTQIRPNLSFSEHKGGKIVPVKPAAKMQTLLGTQQYALMSKQKRPAVSNFPEKKMSLIGYNQLSFKQQAKHQQKKPSQQYFSPSFAKPPKQQGAAAVVFSNPFSLAQGEGVFKEQFAKLVPKESRIKQSQVVRQSQCASVMEGFSQVTDSRHGTPMNLLHQKKGSLQSSHRAKLSHAQKQVKEQRNLRFQQAKYDKVDISILYKELGIEQGRHDIHAEGCRVSEVESRSTVQRKEEVVNQVFDTGAKYVGMKANGMREGKGKYTFKDGTTYDGEWHQNRMHGTGVLYYSDGRVAYSGQWKDDKYNGLGVFHFQKTSSYKGRLEVNNLNALMGYCQRYEGQFEDDMRHGRGKLLFANGEQFEGQFRYDSADGEGVFRQEGKEERCVWRNGILTRRLK